MRHCSNRLRCLLQSVLWAILVKEELRQTSDWGPFSSHLVWTLWFVLGWKNSARVAEQPKSTTYCLTLEFELSQKKLKGGRPQSWLALFTGGKHVKRELLRNVQTWVTARWKRGAGCLRALGHGGSMRSHFMAEFREFETYWTCDVTPQTWKLSPL